MVLVLKSLSERILIWTANSMYWKPKSRQKNNNLWLKAIIYDFSIESNVLSLNHWRVMTGPDRLQYPRLQTNSTQNTSLCWKLILCTKKTVLAAFNFQLFLIHLHFHFQPEFSEWSCYRQKEAKRSLQRFTLQLRYNYNLLMSPIFDKVEKLQNSQHLSS